MTAGRIIIRNPKHVKCVNIPTLEYLKDFLLHNSNPLFQPNIQDVPTLKAQ